jgi:hypothetical protein
MEVFNVGILGFGFMGKMHAYGYKTIPLYYGGLQSDFFQEIFNVLSRFVGKLSD